MDLIKLRDALLMSSGASDALKNWENVSFLWALKDMQIVSRMADKAGMAMPIEAARPISISIRSTRAEMADIVPA